LLVAIISKDDSSRLNDEFLAFIIHNSSFRQCPTNFAKLSRRLNPKKLRHLLPRTKQQASFTEKLRRAKNIHVIATGIITQLNAIGKKCKKCGAKLILWVGFAGAGVRNERYNFVES
jgi:hypothetical protein